MPTTFVITAVEKAILDNEIFDFWDYLFIERGLVTGEADPVRIPIG